MITVPASTIQVWLLQAASTFPFQGGVASSENHERKRTRRTVRTVEPSAGQACSSKHGRVESDAKSCVDMTLRFDIQISKIVAETRTRGVRHLRVGAD